MKLRKLGRTGLQVSELGFGCWAIGGNAYGDVRDEDSLKALETAWTQGVNFYDTADIYGEGHSESLLGRFLKGKPRDKVMVATKAGWDFSSGGHKKNFTPEYLRSACEQSLRRLGIETIDLYQLHNPSLELICQGDAVGVLEGLKKEGKVRFDGISVHTEAEALAVLKDGRFDALQVIFSLLDQRMAAKVFPEAKRKNTGIIVREPLASGLLTGKYSLDHEFPKNDHRKRWSKEKREWDWEKIRLIREELAGADVPLPQAALEFALAYPEVSTVIPGAKTRSQVLQNLCASLEPRLSGDGVRRLREIYGKEPVFQQGLLPR